MKKILVLFLCVFLCACGTKSATQNIVDAGIAKIDRSREIVRIAPTIESAKAAADDALLTARADLQNCYAACESEKDILRAEKKTILVWLFAAIGIIISLIWGKIKELYSWVRKIIGL